MVAVSKAKWLIGTIAFVFMLTFPLWANPYYLSIVIRMGFYALPTMGLCYFMGYGGQISLGQGAFFGIGAYATAILSLRGIPSWASLILATILTGVIAYIIGKPILRLRGFALALVTAAFALIVYLLVARLKLTGSYDGLCNIPSLSFAGLTLTKDWHYFYLVIVLTFIGVILLRNLIQSKIGRGMRAMNLELGGSEAAAMSSGVDIAKLKTQAFTLAAVYTAITGGIYAQYMGHVSPVAADVWASVLIMMMAVIGGVGRLWGGVIGAVTIIGLREGISAIVSQVAPMSVSTAGYEVVSFGIMFTVVLILLPGGLAELPSKVRQLRGKLPTPES
jgi:branched-chain amino acid transport system permease protein